MEKAKQIRRLWLNPKIKGCFSGVEAFHRARNGKYTRKEIREALQRLPVFAENRPLYKIFKRRRVIVHGIDEQWSADLMDIGNIAKYNNGNTFLLSVIDIFSKFGWVIPIKNKKPETTWKAFERILKSSGRCPKFLQVDKGNEFKGMFAEKAKERGIKIFMVQSELKACVVERFNRTIRDKLSLHMQHKNTHNITKVLPMIVRSYNNTRHRSIKMKPSEVNAENEHDVWLNLYGKDELKTKKKPEFSVGDKVLISIYRNVFDKGYWKRYKPEVFTITRWNDTEPRHYYVKDKNGEELIGGFYGKELSRIRV